MSKRKKEVEDEIQEIGDYILKNQLTLREAEEYFQIPRPTLYWRIKNILPRCNSTLSVEIDKMFKKNRNKLLKGGRMKK